MNNLNADEAVSYVKKIIANVRCAICDKLEGSRFRYPCGHTACEDCVSYEEYCPNCSPEPHKTDSQPRSDYPLTQTVRNAANLLKTCQNLIGVNVFQRKRLSEQLRIEKELFPKCIQAPVKYENKRKSTNSSFQNKENRYSTIFPGEEISFVANNKMENSNNYVQQWLNRFEKNLARKPFADLNVNVQFKKHSQNKNVLQNSVDENLTPSVNRKRSHFKTVTNNCSHLNTYRKFATKDSTPKKAKTKLNISYTDYNLTDTQKKCNNDESGIFLDDDLIVIEDSQETVVEKDKNAWLAVIEASKHEDLPTTSLVNSYLLTTNNDNSKHITNINELKINKSNFTKVPFLKKSAIVETCIYCRNEMRLTEPQPVAARSKPVKITIDSDRFVTTITVLKIFKNYSVTNPSNSVSVQTDLNETSPTNNFKSINDYNIDFKDNNDANRCMEHEMSPIQSKNESDTQSLDLFAEDNKKFGDIYQEGKIDKGVIIEESDSDTDLEVSGPMSVKADVHRSCEEREYGILSEIVNITEHETRLRRGPRGLTPSSNNSSEKENYNPNRKKKHISGKKRMKKS